MSPDFFRIRMISHPVQALRERLAGYSSLSGLPAMLCWSVLVGILAAFSTLGFHKGIQFIQAVVTGESGSIVAVTSTLSATMRIVFPVVAGLLAGLLLVWSARIKASANSDYMEAVAIGDGRLSVRQGLLRSLSSLLTVASGGSIGREGAMVHLASLSASVIGRFAHFSTPRLRLLVACGGAAGVAAAYGAPIAGAVFVAEIVIGSLSMRSLGPLLVAAASAHWTMRSLGAYHTLYTIPELPSVPAVHMLPFIVVGLVAGLAAPVFLQGMNRVRALFKRTGLALPWRLALGGLLLGLLLVFVPQVAGNGYSVVSSLLQVPWSVQAVVFILLCKVLATALTVGSGAVGGVFTPALFVGGALGALCAMAVQVVLPGVTAPVALYVLVGMGSFLGAATRAPLMAILMIFEMTLNPQLMMPLVLAGVPAYFVARALAQVSMYDVILTREHETVLRYRLSATRVSELIQPADTVLAPTATVGEALAQFVAYPVRYLYVVDEQQVFLGVVAQQDLTSLLLSQDDFRARPVTEIMRVGDIQPLHPDMSLDQVQDQMVVFRGERLPVVSRGDTPYLLGVVYKSAVLEKYSALKRAVESSPDTVLDLSTRRLPF